MTDRIGFDTPRYIEAQVAAIRAAVEGKTDSLVVEFGGKILQDRHAARVLPGYHEDAKLELVLSLPESEPIFCVSAKDILGGRIRGDFKTRYDDETVRSLNELEKRGLKVKHVALTRLLQGWESETRLQNFIRTIQARGNEVHYFYEIEDYTNTTQIAHHLDRNSFIDAVKPIQIVLSPGGGSGKFNVCLSQLYFLMKKGSIPFYLKLETFPVFDLPIHHPLHLAFMAASADFFDHVMHDSNHGSGAVSYNRDIENYEILRRMSELFPAEGALLRTITSATSMGVNRLRAGIINEDVVMQESYAEVGRRLARYIREEENGQTSKETVERTRQIAKMLWEN